MVENGTTRVLIGRLTDLKPRTHKSAKPPQSDGRGGRIELQLAIAHWIDRCLRSGELEDRKAAARLLRISLARVSQLLDLLLLCPAIQTTICALTETSTAVGAHSLRQVVAAKDWTSQERIWEGRQR